MDSAAECIVHQNTINLACYVYMGRNLNSVVIEGAIILFCSWLHAYLSQKVQHKQCLDMHTIASNIPSTSVLKRHLFQVVIWHNL